MAIGRGIITLQDVTLEIYGDTDATRNLSQCFSDANNSGFDSYFEGAKNSLANFRGYCHLVTTTAGFIYLIYPFEISPYFTYVWSNPKNSNINTDSRDGLVNSNNIVNAPSHFTSAALLCLNLLENNKSDWYLPSKQEMTSLWENISLINSGILSQSGDEMVYVSEVSRNGAWVSTQNTSETAYFINYIDGSFGIELKDYTQYVRAVRIEEVSRIEDYAIGDFALGGIVFNSIGY